MPDGGYKLLGDEMGCDAFFAKVGSKDVEALSGRPSTALMTLLLATQPCVPLLLGVFNASVVICSQHACVYEYILN